MFEFLSEMKTKDWVNVIMLVFLAVGWSTLVTLSDGLNKSLRAELKTNKGASRKNASLGTTAIVLLSLYLAYRLLIDVSELEIVKESNLYKMINPS